MVKVGGIYKTRNFGELIVKSIESRSRVNVEFIKTGYKCQASANNIIAGGVKDKILPHVFGVGFMGDGRYKSAVGGVETPEYRCWHAMMKRCYSSKEQKRNPSYIGCEVCKEWHNFQNFAEWYENNCTNGFQLDKDVNSGSRTGRLYSPDFCLFIPANKNMKHAHSRPFALTSKDGRVFRGDNVREFCRHHRIDHSCIIKVLNGKRKSHKGWTSAIQ